MVNCAGVGTRAPTLLTAAAPAHCVTVTRAALCGGAGGAMKTVSRGEPHDPDYFKFVLEVNLFGTFNVASIAASYMCKQPANADGSRGVIINVASVAAFDGQKGQLACEQPTTHTYLRRALTHSCDYS